jgi:prolyl-tRNA editing enzyme YbaK/EbsC (Cys-tRNA(Pro) deacylase)
MADSSIDRVREAAHTLDLPIEIRVLSASTRTAAEAAAACGCGLAQIVKSLVFEGTESGALLLLLVSGCNRVDESLAEAVIGEPLRRADPQRVRAETGFAIGGVAPIGLLNTLAVWIDETLLNYDSVWAAAGAPNAVFETSPKRLADKIGAQQARLA